MCVCVCVCVVVVVVVVVVVDHPQFKHLRERGGEKWLSSLPAILCALHLAFLNPGTTGTPSYIIPCTVASQSENRVKEFWSPTPLPSERKPQFSMQNFTTRGGMAPDIHTEGRRLTICEEWSMFHPAFLPQVICQVLSHIPFTGLFGATHLPPPIIWQGGLVFKSVTGCDVGLYMHGSLLGEKLQQRKDARRHGEPERLQVLDLLVKGPGEEDTAKIMRMLLEAVTAVAAQYWGSLNWSQEHLLPGSVKTYFTLESKELLPTLQVRSSSEVSFIPWKDVKREMREKGPWQEEASIPIITGAVESPVTATRLGFTMIHYAMHEDTPDLVMSELAKYTSSGMISSILNQPANNGMTPPMMACQNGNSEVIQQLLAEGHGDLVDWRKNWLGLNYAEIAEKAGSQDIADLLSDYKKDPMEVRTRCRKARKLPGWCDYFLLLLLFNCYFLCCRLT